MMKPIGFVAVVALAISCTGAIADVVISTAATENMVCSAGVCAPTATQAVLNASDLDSYIAQTGNVMVTTKGASVNAGRLSIDAPLSWNSATLTLDAQNGIAVNAAVSAGATSANLQIEFEHGNALEKVSFGSGGNIAFASLSDGLSIGGRRFELVNSINGLEKAVNRNPSGAYALAGHFDAGGRRYARAPIPAFSGQFEGLGNWIHNFLIQPAGDDSGLGLFESSSGVIASVQVSGQLKLHNYVRGPAGGLVGVNSGRVINAAASFKIKLQNGSVGGGLIGDNKGTVSSSFADTQMKCFYSSYCGGLVGENEGSIRSSTAMGRINGPGTTVGGLSGQNSVGATIETSWASTRVDATNVNGTANDGGGLVGYNGGSIDGSFAVGAVVSFYGPKTSLGALVGFNDKGATISNSYSNGTADESSGYIGGFTGTNYGAINASYSRGRVAAEDGNPVLGGFVGDDGSSGGISNAYWDVSTSGVSNLSQGAGNIANDPGITGLTTSQFQSGLPAGFDPKIWAENVNVNGGLPYLIANPPG